MEVNLSEEMKGAIFFMARKLMAMFFVVILLMITGCSRGNTPAPAKSNTSAPAVVINPEDAARSKSLTDEADKMKDEVIASLSSGSSSKSDDKSADPLKQAEKKLDEASAKYEEAIKLDPTNVKAYSGMAFIFRSREKPEKAVEVYDKGLEKSPENVDLWALKAKTLFLSKKYEEAAVAYRKLRDLDEKDYIINRYLADCYVRVGKMDEAEKVYNEALAKFPDNVMLNEFCGAFWFNRADSTSDKQVALEMFQKSADCYGTAFKNVGEYVHRMGPRIIFRQAEAYFNKWKISGSKEDRENSIQLFIAYKKLDRKHIYSFSADRMIVEMEDGNKVKKN